jgi:hypothetical protein
MDLKVGLPQPDPRLRKTPGILLGPRLATRLRHYIEEHHGMSASDRPLFSFTKRGGICPETKARLHGKGDK